MKNCPQCGQEIDKVEVADPTQNPVENCIMCGKETEYHFKDHVDFRTGYIEGAGQLCASCYRAGSSEGREMIVVPKSLIRDTPNNLDLGARIRKIFWGL
jgi:hypothetical protein